MSCMSLFSRTFVALERQFLYSRTFALYSLTNFCIPALSVIFLPMHTGCTEANELPTLILMSMLGRVCNRRSPVSVL